MKKKAEEQEILSRLSERVDKAVQLIQELRRERDELKARLEEADRLRNERDEIRKRIETVLVTLEAIDKS